LILKRSNCYYVFFYDFFSLQALQVPPLKVVPFKAYPIASRSIAPSHRQLVARL
jgi:hypothetical protein